MSALPFPEADLSAEDRTYVTGCLMQKNSHEGPERKGHMRMGMRITRLHNLHPLARSRLVSWLDVLSADLGTDPRRGPGGAGSLHNSMFCLNLKVIFLQQIVSK